MEIPLSTMSYVLYNASWTTVSRQEGKGLEKDSSDISGKHTTDPAFSSQLAESEAYSHSQRAPDTGRNCLPSQLPTN